MILFQILYTGNKENHQGCRMNVWTRVSLILTESSVSRPFGQENWTAKSRSGGQGKNHADPLKENERQVRTWPLDRLTCSLNWAGYYIDCFSWYSPEEMRFSFLLAMNLWIEPLKLCFFRNSFFQVLKWIWTTSRFRRFPMSTRSFCREKFPGFSECILSLVGRGSRSTVLASLEVKCKIKAAPIVMLPFYKRRFFRARHSFLVVSLEPITNTLSKSTKRW